MTINQQSMASMKEAIQDFPLVAGLADRYGEVVIFRDNKPKYRLVDLEQNTDLDLTDDERIDVVARRVLNRYRTAFEELAK